MFKRIIKFKLVSGLFAASFAFVAGGAFWSYFALRNSSELVILHFSNIAGITQMGSISNLVYFGIGAAIIVITNFLIALELEERDMFLSKITAAGTLLFGILIFIGFAAIISVN